MTRSLCQKQTKGTAVDEGTADDAAATETTPAMQALIEAASEVQTTQDSSLPTSIDTSKEASPERTMPTEAKNLDGASVQTTTAIVVRKSNTTPTTSIQGTPKRGRERNAYAHLDPNEHAKVNDPIVRPAKRNKNNGKSEKVKSEGNKSHPDDSDGDRADSAEPIEFSNSILSRLFEPDRRRVPELWEFVRLVAPGPANKPPPGQYKWGTRDAIAAYCLKCKLSFTYTPGTSKTVTRHLKAHHNWNGPKIPVPKKEKTAKPKKTKQTSAKMGGKGPNDIADTNTPHSSQRKPSKKGRKDPENTKSLPNPKSQENGSKRNKKAFDLQRYAQKCMDYTSSDEEEYGDVGKRQAEMTKALFRWCVGSYQFSEMNSPLFEKFCKTGDKSFEMPVVSSVMNSMAKSSYENLQTEIKIHVSKLFPQDALIGNKSHEFISVSVRRVKVHSSQGLDIEGRIFYPVRVSFCTPMFRMKSYVIAVIPEESLQGEDKNNGTNLSPYSRAIDLALEKYGFPRDNVSHVVIRGSFDETKSDEFICVLDRLDGIFGKALRSATILPEWIKELLYRGPPMKEESNYVPETSPSAFCTIRAHETLVASLPPGEETETAKINAANKEADKSTQCHVIACLLDITTPLRDAIQTLSNDLYPTVGLAIPVLRRVNRLLHKRLLKSDGGKAKKAVHEDLKPFLSSIVEDFKKKFEPFLETNPDLMWTMLLDPRLIGMPGLSEAEKTEVKSALAIEVAKIVEVVNQKEHNHEHEISSQDKPIPTSRNTENWHSSSSTMEGIFWGDKSDSTECSGINSDQSSSVVKDAEQYAKKNVESYFNTVHSQRKSKDPLLWWKNNQDQFPEMAILARKWISASAIYGRKGVRENESTNIVLSSFSDTESICRMIILHDNNDIL